MSVVTYNLFPEIEPFNKKHLKVSDLHHIYYEQCGNPQGSPIVFLHGGPGSGCSPTQRRFFDPAYYHIILFDQRGCGRSMPQGETNFNTTHDLVADMELLRQELDIAKWHVFGGSWGSTLALAYAIANAQHVTSLILRGIFLSRQSELDWFLGDVQHFYPEVWHKLVQFLPKDAQCDVLGAYTKFIFSDDNSINAPAAVQWNAFESAIMRLKPMEPIAPPTEPKTKTAEDLQKESISECCRARVQLHYINNHCFIDGELMLEQAKQLAHIPTVIVQGRYDMVCPPQTAWVLHQVMPHAGFEMIADAGHSAMELGITSALVAATERFKTIACITSEVKN